MTRILASISAGAGALNLFLLGYPGDLVSQELLLVVGGVAAVAAAVVASLTPKAA